jgi:hypothetical protein
MLIADIATGEVDNKAPPAGTPWKSWDAWAASRAARLVLLPSAVAVRIGYDAAAPCWARR